MIIYCSFEKGKTVPEKATIQSYIDTTSDRSLLESYFDRLPEDSLKDEFVFKTSYKFYKQNDSIQFRYWNQKSRHYSYKKEDTLGIAESYWDLANFFYFNNVKDSSYYYYNKAHKYYNKAEASFYAGRMLLNMAIVQSDARDYTGSEINTINSIRILKPLKKHKQLHMAYNNLGVVFNGMREFEDAIKYHELALYHKEKLDDNISKAASFNNIGVVYQNMGDYKSAEGFFKKALAEENLFSEQPKLYAMVKDNLAYNNMKQGLIEEVENSFKRALSIRDSVGHLSGKAINYIHLGEYYLTVRKDTGKAINYFEKSRDLAISSNNNRDHLSSLLFLIKLDSERENTHLKQYIEIRDSLDKEERAIRNKFARIKFETDQFIQKNKALNYQQQLIISGFSILLVILTLLYNIRNQRINNKKLILEKQQKEANEEIYNLLLTQQKKVEEGKEKEKFRISSELHDGVLSKLFGVRMTLESLNNENDPDSILTRSINIDELHKLEVEIRNISHDLANDKENEEVDLIEIIQEFTLKKERLSGIDISIEVDNGIQWDTIGNKIKIHLYRIIQELVYNAIKYSKASELIIKFSSIREKIQLQVSDNGKGFNVEKTKKGIGINNVYTRTSDINGEINIDSSFSGTKFTILIPY